MEFHIPTDEDLDEIESKLRATPIRPDATPADVQRYEAQLDRLYTQISFYAAETEAAYLELKRQYAHAWKPIYLALAEEGVSDDGDEETSRKGRKKGMSQKDREIAAQVQAAEQTVYLNGDPVTFMEALHLVERTSLRIEAILSVIRARHERLILVASSQKLEANLVGTPASNNASPRRKALWRSLEEE